MAHAGFNSLNGPSIGEKILLPLVLSPLAGFLAGFLMMNLITLLFWHVNRHKANGLFHRLQVLSAAFMATSHGLNDAQKTMGIITLALFLFGEIDAIHVPLWVKICCATAMACGTAVGGWKIVKTMGHKIFKLEPVHGFAAETSASLVIAGASMFGAPVSTTHTITASIFGAAPPNACPPSIGAWPEICSSPGRSPSPPPRCSAEPAFFSSTFWGSTADGEPERASAPRAPSRRTLFPSLSSGPVGVSCRLFVFSFSQAGPPGGSAS